MDERTIDELTIDDETSFRHVGLYGDLKTALQKAKYKFRLLPEASRGHWDRAVLLNLTFWGTNANDTGDILTDDRIDADVVAHVAWHHLAAKALASTNTSTSTSTSTSTNKLSADALFLGESIASAFDVYLVGRLLGHAPHSSFLGSQIPAMAETANAAGMSEEDFEALLEDISKDPERAFEDLRQLLFDATTALVACSSADEALTALDRFRSHRFEPLLHHYELSNWVLYARAYASDALKPDPAAREIDRALRESTVSLDWLTSHWMK